MRNKNHIRYYKKLKSLFPKIDYKEGRFLRDLKQQLKEYAMCHPDCSYQEIEDTFGKVEDVVYDYVQEQGADVVYESVQARRRKKIVMGLVIGILCLAYLTYSVVWYTSYKKFSEDMIHVEESTIDRGDINYE